MFKQATAQATPQETACIISHTNTTAKALYNVSKPHQLETAKSAFQERHTNFNKYS